LIVNGVEIYSQIKSALDAYHLSQYFEFGLHTGEAFDAVFLQGTTKARNVKNPSDVKAYEFLLGFFTAFDLGTEYDFGLINYQALYNALDHKGVSIYGPVENAMK